MLETIHDIQTAFAILKFECELDPNKISGLVRLGFAQNRAKLIFYLNGCFALEYGPYGC